MKLRTYAKIAAVPVGLLVSGLIVAQTSSAAFTAQTQTAANSWAAGQLTLTNDKVSTAAFAATNIVPGQSGTNTIKVDYTSGAKAAVKMYATAPVSNELATALQLTINEGATQVFSGSLASFSAKNDSASGVGTWTPTASGSQTYTVSWTLPGTVSSSTIQGQTAGVTFAWEATSQAS